MGESKEMPRCLVVDNDMGVAQLAQAFFQRKGIQVSFCRTGEEAWEHLASEEAWEGVDLLLLDLRMPGMGGVGLLEKMAERQGGPRVVVMSGFVSEEDQAFLAREERVVAVLQKPFDLLELYELVQEAVREKRGRESGGGERLGQQGPTLPFGEGEISLGEQS
ncbi:MAG TPA: response regulator [Planctomycetes bacterium]|nr:response regulator [Planctomycetota bacterium]